MAHTRARTHTGTHYPDCCLLTPPDAAQHLPELARQPVSIEAHCVLGWEAGGCDGAHGARESRPPMRRDETMANGPVATLILDGAARVGEEGPFPR